MSDDYIAVEKTTPETSMRMVAIVITAPLKNDLIDNIKEKIYEDYLKQLNKENKIDLEIIAGTIEGKKYALLPMNVILYELFKGV